MAVVETATATKPDVLLTFGKVHNPLRLPHETTSKAAHTCSVSNILAWKCASRCNSVHFLHLTSKSAPNPSVFDAFDFEMCFAPERRPLFRHVNFQKVVREWRALCMLTCKCASRHNGVHFFMSHLASWLRTRRFSEPTFRPSGATNH